MPSIMMDSGDPIVVNTTEVGRGAKHPNNSADIQLVRFYLNIDKNLKTPPSGSFDTAGFDGMSEEPTLPNRILQFQYRQNAVVKGNGYISADGKVSVPHNASDGSLGYGSGPKHGLYTIRQMGTTWGIYKVVHMLPETFKISSHPLCPTLLASKLLPLGQ